jgi:cobalt/nickel transport protein
MKTITKLWILIVILAILSPIGLLLPEHFKAGAAWGEWGPDEIKELVGYIPKGLEKLASFWTAPIPDYAFKGWEEKGLRHLSLAYIISAVAGIAIVIALIYLMGKLISKKD